MIPILTIEQAQGTILNRKPLIETEISLTLQKSIKNIFGENLTPYQVVKMILEDIKRFKDSSVIKWMKRIDQVDIGQSFEVSNIELNNALEKIGLETLNALKVAQNRITIFHKQQPINSWITSNLGGQLGQLIRPIERVGVYIPGGSAPLPSTILMSVIPAIEAGVKEIIIANPPNKKNELDPIILATCAMLINNNKELNIRIFKIGGAQAIGAMAFGTESIPKVDKVVGPGNIFVSIAKKEVYGNVGIDGIRGPTETMIIADESANPELIAADLLAQAEHDFLSIPILLTPSEDLALEVRDQISSQIKSLSRKEIIKESLASHGGLIITQSIKDSINIMNQFAPEHLSLIIKNPWDLIPEIQNTGTIFLGEASCEVMGDYVAGPSHIIPTGGAARFESPLTVVDFVKIINLIGLDYKTVNEIAPSAEILANSELLTAHASSARRRYK